MEIRVRADPLRIMQAAMDLTLEYTHERHQFGKPIATMQLMQGKLAGKAQYRPLSTPKTD